MSKEKETVKEEALTPLDDVKYEGYIVQDIPQEDIYEAENMRTGALNIAPLIESIRIRGLIHPVRLRTAPEGAPHELPYELIAGHRRLASYRALGLARVPAIVDNVSDEEVLAERITENLQREDPNPIDEARAMQQMIQLLGWTQARVAKELGVVPSQVSKRLSLLGLAEPVVQLVAEGKLSSSHGEELARLAAPKAQEEMAEIAIRSSASVAKLASYVRKVQEDERKKAEIEGAGSDPSEDSVSQDETGTSSDDSESPKEALPKLLDERTPLDMATAEMMASMPYLKIRPTLTAGMRQRGLCYLLLRASNDVEALHFLEQKAGVTRRTLWAWVMRQPQAEIERLVDMLMSRWFQAGHRFPSFSADLVATLGTVTDTAKDPLWGMPGHEHELPEAAQGLEDD